MTHEELGAIRRRADWDPDSIFVDAAREDVPKLLAEIERLQAKLARVEGLVKEWAGSPYARDIGRADELREALSGGGEGTDG